MTNPDELEPRVAALEVEVASLREAVDVSRSDAAAARVLAGAADRDVSELRGQLQAHTSVLNALRETQLEQGQEIRALRTEMREGFARVDGRIDGLETEMRGGFAKVNLGMTKIVELLTPGTQGDQ